MLDPTKRRYPMSKGKGGSPKDGRRGDFIPAIPARDAWRAQTKPFVHQDPETLQRLYQTILSVFEGLLQRHRSVVASHRDRGSGSGSPGRRGVWLTSTWRRLTSISPIFRADSPSSETAESRTGLPQGESTAPAISRKLD